MAWHDREEGRIENGYYETTAVLTRINNSYPGYFLHVSRTDRQLVAYTQSPEKGERDIQTPIKLGVFMRKLNNLWRDTYIADCVAEHFAELNISFELIAGPDVTANYEKYPWGSCMSNKRFKSNYKYDVLGNFYNGDRLYVALVKDGYGSPIGRSVVDPIRKVFIRSYGDRQKVERVLINAGYQLGGYVDRDSNPQQYAVMPLSDAGGVVSAYLPYLDHRNQNGSDLRGCYVRHNDGSVTLALVDRAGLAFRNLTSHNFQMSTATTTAGMLSLCCYNREQFKREVFGTTADLLAPGPAQDLEVCYAYLDGAVVKRLKADVPVDYTQLSTLFAGCWVTAYCPPGTPSFGTYIDTPANREGRGFKKLDAELYPDHADTWVTSYDYFVLSDGKVVKCSDTERLYTLTGHEMVHNSDPRLKTAIKTHGGVLVEKAAEQKIVRTDTKVKVVPGVHDIVCASTPAGLQWMFKRSAMMIRDQYLSYWVPRRGPAGPSPRNLYEEYIAQALRGEADIYKKHPWCVPSDAARDAFRRRDLLGMFNITVGRGGKVYLSGRYAFSTPYEVALEDLLPKVTHAHGDSTTGSWNVFIRYLAEAFALDYNLQPVVAQVPQIQEVAHV